MRHARPQGFRPHPLELFCAGLDQQAPPSPRPLSRLEHEGGVSLKKKPWQRGSSRVWEHGMHLLSQLPVNAGCGGSLCAWNTVSVSTATANVTCDFYRDMCNCTYCEPYRLVEHLTARKKTPPPQACRETQRREAFIEQSSRCLTSAVPGNSLVKQLLTVRKKRAPAACPSEKVQHAHSREACTAVVEHRERPPEELHKSVLFAARLASLPSLVASQHACPCSYQPIQACDLLFISASPKRGSVKKRVNK